MAATPSELAQSRRNLYLIAGIKQEPFDSFYGRVRGIDHATILRCQSIVIGFFAFILLSFFIGICSLMLIDIWK